MTQVSDVVTALEQRYPPRLAEGWDRNGLVVGRPSATVEKVLLAVDPVLAVLEEAVDEDCDLIVTHHPLLLRGVTTVRADTAKGAMVHELIERGIALFNAHTNADAAAGGVADALAADLGVVDVVPLVPDAADPALGSGRVGRLADPCTLHQFAERVAEVLPATAHGVRVAGDLAGRVETVAVLGGSGDSFLDAVRAAGADVYVTADLRHHPASEARELAALGDGRPYLVDVAHFASEWSWLRGAAQHLEDALGLETHVSTLTTDPWTARFGATGS
ncbi:Nif3-like dinuclear metal center hexameric protein [Demequina sp. NBRC 110052]|uniref:Nif3-like dinuclear metal center hexameric protein n=1 Tax=Demequina sp. NBRC 110052 TaxID=1570341 RepID=UPI0009FD648C|nr:Nif3-like dinuclear metal center hexameric protein [Demequina sp. NBRC 110052]